MRQIRCRRGDGVYNFVVNNSKPNRFPIQNFILNNAYTRQRKLKITGRLFKDGKKQEKFAVDKFNKRIHTENRNSNGAESDKKNRFQLNQNSLLSKQNNSSQ